MLHHGSFPGAAIHQGQFATQFFTDCKGMFAPAAGVSPPPSSLTLMFSLLILSIFLGLHSSSALKYVLPEVPLAGCTHLHPAVDPLYQAGAGYDWHGQPLASSHTGHPLQLAPLCSLHKHGHKCVQTDNEF